jgi:hypothetical protein
MNLYTQIGGDDERLHKRLHILDAREGPIEITKVSAITRALLNQKKFIRYFFPEDSDRDAARAKGGGLPHEGP